MEISQLYTYPIKSLRPTSLTKATLTPYGFPYDRRFMLHKILPDGGGRKNMHVPEFPIMTRFLTDIVFPEGEDGGEEENASQGRIVVTFHPPVGSENEGDIQTLEIPIQPDVEGLESIDIDLQNSPTRAYDMGEKYNSWFTSCFGFEVTLSYLGPKNTRQILGSMNPNTTDATPATAAEQNSGGGGGWLSSLSNSISYISGASKPGQGVETGITFADFACYLVVSETSRDEVSSRLPEGEEMDITKFRPGIVVKGPKTAFEEDYWAEIKIGEGGDDDGGEARIALTANCARCVSVNIDFETGKAGTGESGKVLKKMMKDRRVDAGEKYSPIFGRYGFPGKSSTENPRIAVGDKVEVTKRNDGHTKLYWPGIFKG